MSVDKSPTPEWSDEEVDSLLDQLVKRANERDDVDLSQVRTSSRRGFLAGIGATLSATALAGNAGANSSSTASTEPDWTNATGNSATEDLPFRNVWAEDGHFQSVSTETLGNGPIAFSSQFDTVQAALDAAAGGHLFIDDTKREEGVQLSPTHKGTTIEWVGDNYVDKPATPTNGEATFRVADGVTTTVPYISFIRPRIKNPDLADVDIGNEDTIAGADRRSAIESYPPATTATPGGAKGWRIVDPQIHHVQGYGVAIEHPIDTLNVSGGHVYQTAFDGVYSQSIAGTSENAAITFEGTLCEDNGRHNFSIAGDPVEGSVHISGTGKRAYTGGIDLENASNVHLDGPTLYEPDQSGTGGAVHAGLNVSGLSDTVGGSVHVVDANSYSANLGGANYQNLTVVYEQSNTQNPANNPEVHIRGNASGKVEVVGNGGGTGYAALDINGPSKDVQVKAVVENAYGASVRTYGNPNAKLDLVSIDPVQGGTSVTAEQRAHIFTDGGATDLIVGLKAVDSTGNVEYGVSSGGAADDYNQYIGTVRGAYATSAVNGLGANTDTTRLIT